MENYYESIIALDPRVEDEKAAKLIDKLSQIITQNGGTIEKADKWGKRKFSYEVNGQKEGNFFFFLFKTSSPQTIAELGGTCRVTEEILQNMTVKVIKVKKIPAKLSKKKKKKEVPRPAAVKA